MFSLFQLEASNSKQDPKPHFAFSIHTMKYDELNCIMCSKCSCFYLFPFQVQQALDQELSKVAKAFGGSGSEDMTQFPAIKFNEPTLEDVNLEKWTQLEEPS